MVETDFSPEWLERIDAAERLAEAGCIRLQKYFPQWNIQVEASAANPALALLEKAKAWPADLIVVGTHGRSALSRVVLGSVSLKVVREAPCSVRVGRLRQSEGPVRLLIGNDGSSEAAAVIDEICRRSWPAGAEVRILAVHESFVATNAERISLDPHVYDKINEDEHFRLRLASSKAEEKLRHSGLVVSSIVEEGDPKEALVRQARDWKADTVLIGARGMGKVERFLLGSVSSATVAHAPCTVEIVRAR